MRARSNWGALAVGILLCLVPVALVYGSRWKAGRDRDAIWKAIWVLYGAQSAALGKGEGYWTGDIAELCRMGLIPRELAEADTALLEPLVDRPRPYHGYYVTAMESGPSPTTRTENRFPLKGGKRSREVFAICVYPAQDNRPDLPVWLLCPFGLFRKESEGNRPVLDWPAGELRRTWAIVD